MAKYFINKTFAITDSDKKIIAIVPSEKNANMILDLLNGSGSNEVLDQIRNLLDKHKANNEENEDNEEETDESNEETEEEDNEEEESDDEEEEPEADNAKEELPEENKCPICGKYKKAHRRTCDEEECKKKYRNAKQRAYYASTYKDILSERRRKGNKESTEVTQDNNEKKNNEVKDEEKHENQPENKVEENVDPKSDIQPKPTKHFYGVV